MGSVRGARRHPGRPDRRLQRAALVLIGLGVMSVVAAGALLGYGAWQERQLTKQWDQIMSTIPPTVATAPPAQAMAQSAPPAAPTAVPPAPIVTRTTKTPIAFGMRVPRIDYYSAVVEGVDVQHLAMGPGHYPSTAYPGRPGTVGVAAHNSYWLRFDQVKTGDQIVLETRYGTFTYRVTGSRIVSPDDKTVFSANSSENRLTLTTCWPLWAGAFANRRLAIFAEEVGGVA